MIRQKATQSEPRPSSGQERSAQMRPCATRQPTLIAPVGRPAAIPWQHPWQPTSRTMRPTESALPDERARNGRYGRIWQAALKVEGLVLLMRGGCSSHPRRIESARREAKLGHGQPQGGGAAGPAWQHGWQQTLSDVRRECDSRRWVPLLQPRAVLDEQPGVVAALLSADGGPSAARRPVASRSVAARASTSTSVTSQIVRSDKTERSRTTSLRVHNARLTADLPPIASHHLCRVMPGYDRCCHRPS